MKDLLYKILFFSTVAILLLFLVQTATQIVSFEPLHGVTEELEKPKLTFRNYADGSWQQYIDDYFNKHLGFREPMIRHYNQYLWDLFKKPNNAHVIRGKKNCLFEDSYVRDHYESLMYDYTNDTAEMRKIFETEVLRLWKVQELLKEYDIHIFVNITPGKDLIYPEYLPENRFYLRPEGLHAYDYYKKRFDELGVNYIDNIALFKQLKNNVDYPLFPKTGTHWSNIASVYVFDSILRYMEVLGNQKLRDLEISKKYTAPTRKPDDDLEQLLNLARPIPSPPNYYVDVKVIDDSTAAKPYFTVIGDSYHWNFIYNIPLLDIFQKVPYWYYNYIIYGDEENTGTLNLDLEKELMRTDYIMLNYGTTSLYGLGSCFLPRALLYLCYDQATIDSVASRVIETIKKDKKWYAELLEESKIKHKKVEDILYDLALYMIKTNPEKYIDELKGDKLPTSRNKNLRQLRTMYNNQ